MAAVAALNQSMFGVHFVGLNLKPEQYTLLAHAGVKTVRSNAVFWGQIERERGKYNWIEGDYTVAQASENGMAVMFILMAPPEWAQQAKILSHDRSGFYKPNSMTEWEKYCRIVMERYRGRVHYWEVWNEENAPAYWFKDGSPESYVELMKIAYRVAKEVDAENVVVMGGVVGADGEIKFGGRDFFKRALQLGISDSIDVYSIHYTSHQLNKYEWFLDLIRRYGDSNKPIWNTEENYRQGVGGVSKAFLVDKYLLGFEKVFYFLAKDISGGIEKTTDGLLDSLNNPKPQYYEFMQITKFIEGNEFLGSRLFGNVIYFFFTPKNGAHALSMVAWNISGVDEAVIQVPLAGAVACEAEKAMIRVNKNRIVVESDNVPLYMTCRMGGGGSPIGSFRSTQAELALIRSKLQNYDFVR